MKSDKVLIIADLLTNNLHYDFGLLNRFWKMVTFARPELNDYSKYHEHH